MTTETDTDTDARARETAAPPSPPPVAEPPPSQKPRLQRTPFLAGVLSAVLPGFGNVYNGLFTRGFLNFLIFFSLFFTAAQTDGGPALALLIPAMIFTWLFGIVDAYRHATLINAGVTEAELQDQLPQIKGGSGGLAVGVALFLIGLYGLLTQAFDIDLSVIFDYWYVVLMGLGGWMTYQGLQSRRQHETPDEL